MQDKAMAPGGVEAVETTTTGRTQLRAQCRDLALESAMRKRAAGVPTYSVPEAAALLSVSQEHMYRLVRTGAFPAVRMRLGAEQGRYVVPAKAVDRLLEAATDAGCCVDVQEFANNWPSGRSGGAR